MIDSNPPGHSEKDEAGFGDTIKDRHAEDAQRLLQRCMTNNADRTRAEELLRLVIDASPDSICLKDGQGRWQKANAAQLSLFGLQDIRYAGKGDRELAELSPWGGKALEHGEEADEQAWQKQETSRTQQIISGPEGESRVFDVIRVPLYYQDGSRKGMVVLGRDITQLRNIEKEKLFSSTIFQSAVEGIVITDAENRIQLVNPAFERITGYSEQEVLGKNPRILKSDRHDRSFYEKMWKDIQGQGSWEGEIWNRRKNGETYPERLSIKALYDEQGNIINFISIFTDLSEIKTKEEKLRIRFYYDPLTNLPNRQLFLDRLKQEIDKCKGTDILIGTLFIDLDRFKNINNSLGHFAGDRILQNVAETIDGAKRKGDTIARIGGDEFCVLLRDTRTIEELGLAAESFLDVFDTTFDCEEFGELYLAASAGISVYPNDGHDEESLLKNAELAMLRAKSSQEEGVRFFAPEMEKPVLQKVQMERDIRKALETAQFTVFFQPIVHASSGTVTHLEALVRWQHPERGMISPGSFIPLAEECCLIYAIDQYVIWQVNQLVSQWARDSRKGTKDIKVKINLSALQFYRTDLVDFIFYASKSAKVPYNRINFEITENILMSDSNAAMKRLQELRKIGFGIDIDDFGTGYSSLSYLTRLPIQGLKIDQAFVADLEHNSGNAAVTHAILELAKSLRLTVVAEGVETEGQLRFLQRLGCDYLQGYYFSRPIPEDEILKFLARPEVRI
ncbi:MAG: EAL domain-containing protein [Synergistales bacterium]|nr:EAL domain-containing protein [Synergistales bacterium]